MKPLKKIIVAHALIILAMVGSTLLLTGCIGAGEDASYNCMYAMSSGCTKGCTRENVQENATTCMHCVGVGCCVNACNGCMDGISNARS